MNKKVLALTFFAFVCSNAVAESDYVCITDFVSGFHYDSDRNNWKHATFLPGERFMIHERSEDAYRVERIDDHSSWSAICTARTDQTEDSFSCTSGTNQFHFNRKQLRFTAFRYFGYWNGSTDSISISIGKCFPN
jgi:hypothetical protein